jgi:hypothetical protein
MPVTVASSVQDHCIALLLAIDVVALACVPTGGR